MIGVVWMLHAYMWDDWYIKLRLLLYMTATSFGVCTLCVLSSKSRNRWLIQTKALICQP